MGDYEMIVKEMTRAECIQLLVDTRLGRLACSKDDQPYVVPIYFVIDGGYLYSFSLLGKKVDWLRANSLLCFQADNFDDDGKWQSVVVEGHYEELTESHDQDHAWSLLSQHANWWEPGGMKPSYRTLVPHIFYRVGIDQITGRKVE